MFGQSSGDHYYGDCVKFDREDNLLGQSVILDTKARKLYVKVCNASANPAKAKINLSRFGIKSAAVKTVITGNEMDENNYDQHPIEPVSENVKVKKSMDMEVPAFSMTMYTISL